MTAFDRDAALAGMLPDHERPLPHAFSLGAHLHVALVAVANQIDAYEAIETLSVDDLRGVALYALHREQQREWASYPTWCVS